MYTLLVFGGFHFVVWFCFLMKCCLVILKLVLWNTTNILISHLYHGDILLA